MKLSDLATVKIRFNLTNALLPTSRVPNYSWSPYRSQGHARAPPPRQQDGVPAVSGKRVQPRSSTDAPSIVTSFISLWIRFLMLAGLCIWSEARYEGMTSRSDNFWFIFFSVQLFYSLYLSWPLKVTDPEMGLEINYERTCVVKGARYLLTENGISNKRFILIPTSR